MEVNPAEKIIVKTEKVEVRLLKPFPVIKETLERIGIANRETKKLYPSCYVHQDNDKTYISHFKELLRNPQMEEGDLKRKNTIVWLLTKWNLIKIVDSIQEKQIFENILPKRIFILSKEQKDSGWTISNKVHFTTNKN